MDALAGGSQGDGARTLFIQICSQADRIPIYNGAVSSAAGCCLRCLCGFFFCRDLRGVLLPELVQLALKLVLKLSGAANIRTRREFDAALLQRVHGSGAYLFVHPNIGAKAATCALKLLFTFTF